MKQKRFHVFVLFFASHTFLVQALAGNFAVHNKTALSATLRLIKRKQIRRAPGGEKKIQWVDSRRDTWETEAPKINVLVLSYGSSWLPG